MYNPRWLIFTHGFHLIWECKRIKMSSITFFKSVLSNSFNWILQRKKYLLFQIPPITDSLSCIISNIYITYCLLKSNVQHLVLHILIWKLMLFLTCNKLCSTLWNPGVGVSLFTGRNEVFLLISVAVACHWSTWKVIQKHTHRMNMRMF